jgi:hypothetical protein
MLRRILVRLDGGSEQEIIDIDQNEGV